jgi:hypothetical protein
VGAAARSPDSQGALTRLTGVRPKKTYVVDRTTAVRVLATLLCRHSGRAEVAGFDVTSQPAQVRARIGDPIGAHPSWITNHAVLMAVAWPLLLIAVFFPLSLHRFRRLSH